MKSISTMEALEGRALFSADPTPAGPPDLAVESGKSKQAQITISDGQLTVFVAGVGEVVSTEIGPQ
jgi:hypothetical protein